MRTATLVFAILAVGVVNLVANYHWHQQDADALARAQATQQATWQMAVIDRQAACLAFWGSTQLSADQWTDPCSPPNTVSRGTVRKYWMNTPPETSDFANMNHTGS